LTYVAFYSTDKGSEWGSTIVGCMPIPPLDGAGFPLPRLGNKADDWAVASFPPLLLPLEADYSLLFAVIWSILAARVLEEILRSSSLTFI